MVRATEAVDLLVVDVEVYVWIRLEALQVVELVARADYALFHLFFTCINARLLLGGFIVFKKSFIFNLFVLLLRVVGLKPMAGAFLSLQELLLVDGTSPLAYVAHS